MSQDFIPDSDFVSDESKYGEGVTPALKAAGLGAARSATFGLSDEFLTGTGLMKPEEIQAYKKHQEIATGVGEVGGILGAILAPEGELLGAAAAPVRGVAKLGGAVSEAAAAALPEASGTVGKILSQAGAHAAGSAVEGAAYGLGQSVSEHALGDPDLNAEKVIANVGFGALTGGALGAMFGGVKGGIQSKFPRFMSEVDKAAIDGGDFETIAKNSDLSEPEKQGFIEGLTKLRPDAPEIKQAAEDLGAPVLPGMISDSEAVRKGQSALLEGPPSYPALKAQQLAATGFEKAGQAVEETLGSAGDTTKATLGEGLGDMVSSRVEELNKPIGELYNELSSRYETIPLSEKSAPSIARNIRQLDELRLSPSSPEAKIASRVADEIENLKTVDDVRKYKSMLNRSVAPTASSGEKHMVSVLSEKLSNLEQNSVVRFAENVMKTDKAEAKIKSLLDLREAADAQYSVFKDKLNRLGDILGKKRVYGAQDLLTHIENMTPEQISGKLLNRNNSKALDWFSKEFPEGMKAISDHQKGLIRQAAMKDGEFNIRRALAEVDKMPKEFQEKIFSADELKKMASAKKYIQAFPKNFNPSNTSNASAFRHFFEGPTGAIVGNLRDVAIDKFINAATSSADETTGFISGLATIEKNANKTTRQVGTGVKAIFSNESAGSPAKGFLAISPQERRDKHDKVGPEISDLSANPQKLIDKLHDSTAALSQYAPNTAAGAQGVMIRATQFLQQKLPGNNVPQSPLSTKYKPSDAELAKWHKYFSAVEDPISVLHHVAAGTITPEPIEAVSAVYPKLMQEMQTAVMDKLTTHMGKEKPLPYRTKMALSLFLGSDMVNSLNPQSMLANQNVLASATAAKANQEKMSSVNNKGLGNINKADRLLTAQDRAAQRKEA